MTPRFAAHLALMVAGLAAVVWALTGAANPVIMCRDVVMGPGSVCANAQGTATQTYEQRLAAAQAARPVIVGMGLAATAFGGYLALTSRRGRPGASGR